MLGGNVKIIILIILLLLFSCSDNGKKSGVDLCKDFECSNGKCFVNNDVPFCFCNEGFQDEDKNNTCLPDCKTANLNCSNKGNCIVENGETKCECFDSYSGENCESCVIGFQDNDNNGECLPDCETSEINCGNKGKFNDDSGEVKCDCDLGYSGDLCNVFDGSYLKIVLSDQWGRPLEVDDIETISFKKDNINFENVNETSFESEIFQSGHYEIKISSIDYFPVTFEFDYDGKNAENSITNIKITNPDNSADYPVTNHAYVYHRINPEEVKINYHHIFYLGIAHKWFAPTGFPFHKGNNIKLFISPEEAWIDMTQSMDNAQSEINLTSWSWDSDTEVIHPFEILPEEERDENRIAKRIKQENNVKTKLILAQLWGQDSLFTNWMTGSEELKTYAESPSDNVEFMAQANPTSENYTIFFNSSSLSQKLSKIYKDYDLTFPETFVEEEYINPFICGDKDTNGNCTFSHYIDLHLPLNIETSIASYHQKFFTIDKKLAYVGGINTDMDYWDTKEHGVFEYRRMPFDATAEERDLVKKGNEDGIKTPAEIKPYKDYMIKAEGPIVKDVDDIFTTRWNHLIYNRVKYSENTTESQYMSEYPKPIETGIKAQLNLTMPRPFQENTILESQILAIKQAQFYIYIEDQYFRMPIINQAIAKRMEENQNLKLIIITQPVNEWTDLGCYWTHFSYHFYMDEFPNRVAFYQLISFDYTYPEHDCEGAFTDTSCYGNEMEGHFKKFYVHSKMLIIDDKYMNIGSANKNNRGYTYEGEMNISVLDETWVKEERKKIFENILGSYYDFNVDSWNAEDIDDIFSYLQLCALKNETAYNSWDSDSFENDEYRDHDFDIDYTIVSKESALPDSFKVKGFLFPVTFAQPSDCLIENIGEDAAK